MGGRKDCVKTQDNWHHQCYGASGSECRRFVVATGNYIVAEFHSPTKRCPRQKQQQVVLTGASLVTRSHSHIPCSAGAALANIKQQRRGLKSAGTMSGSSEAGTFVNDIPDYEQGLDFETCDWLDDVENDNEIGGGWGGRHAAAQAVGGRSSQQQRHIL